MKLSISTMFNNEALYLLEWIEFHLLVGVEKFYLYSRLSTDNSNEVLRPYVERGIVDVKEWPYPVYHSNGREALIDVHQDIIDRLRGRQEWLALINTDEFLFSPRYDTVPEAIAALPQGWGSSIGVHWMMFGSSGLTEYDDRPVIERFTKRPLESNYFNRWYKSIARMDDPDLNTLGTSHRNRTRWGTYNGNGDLLTEDEHLHTSSLLRLNHYFTKTRAEWEARHPLHQDGVDYDRDERRWADVQDMAVDDRTIWKHLPELKRRLAQ